MLYDDSNFTLMNLNTLLRYRTALEADLKAPKNTFLKKRINK